MRPSRKPKTQTKPWTGTIENGRHAKQIRRSSFSFKKTSNGSSSQWTLVAMSPKNCQGRASLLSNVRSPSTRTGQPLELLLQLALCWIAWRGDGHTTHAIILKDFMSLLQMKSGLGSPYWHVTSFFEDVCEYSALDMQESRKIAEQIY